MATTPAGLPAPALTDAPNGPSQVLALAVAADSRVIGSFASAAARTAAYGAGTNPTAPTVGQVTYRQDAAVYEWWTGSIWHPQSGGVMGTVGTAVQSTSTGTNGVTETLSGLSLSLAGIVTGRNYRIVWGGWYRATVAATEATAVIHASQAAITTASPVVGGCKKYLAQTNFGPEDANEALWTPGAGGTWNLQLGIKSTGGTGASAISGGQQNAFLTVYVG